MSTTQTKSNLFLYILSVFLMEPDPDMSIFLLKSLGFDDCLLKKILFLFYSFVVFLEVHFYTGNIILDFFKGISLWGPIIGYPNNVKHVIYIFIPWFLVLKLFFDLQYMIYDLQFLICDLQWFGFKIRDFWMLDLFLPIKKFFDF